METVDIQALIKQDTARYEMKTEVTADRVAEAFAKIGCASMPASASGPGMPGADPAKGMAWRMLGPA